MNKYICFEWVNMNLDYEVTYFEYKIIIKNNLEIMRI